jgi:hypothetical protein
LEGEHSEEGHSEGELKGAVTQEEGLEGEEHPEGKPPVVATEQAVRR